MSNEKNSKKSPITRRITTFLYRSKIAVNYIKQPIKNSIHWLLKSKETTNFTYELNDLNIRYLIAFISEITNKDYDEIAKYINELLNDKKLKNHIEKIIKTRNISDADLNAKYGRRLGWYAVVRAIKPKIIIETGVDKGLGACVLTAALIMNSKEGFSGRYFGTDIDPQAGYLLTGDYKKFGKILYGDSIESLEKFNEKVDLFINDSEHSSEYEAKEYETIKDKLTEKAIILGDNSHNTDKLLKFANENGKRFIYFQERPKNHWYPGAGIGAAFSK